MLDTMQIQPMEDSFMYNAVGIDASKFKSTITVIQPAGVVIRKPFDVLHTSDGLNTLVTYLQALEGETRAVIECTGRYHEPVVKKLSEAGIFISAVNPKLIVNTDNLVHTARSSSAYFPLFQCTLPAA